MKKIALVLMLVGITAAAHAEDTFNVNRRQLGNAGDPAQTVTVGTEKAVPVGDGMYFLPQYLPAYPTAAPIWPRVVRLKCKQMPTGIVCDGFHWTPDLGRGEYLYVIPEVEQPAPPPPPVIEKHFYEKEIVEVPAKRGNE
jgi:hypothetical protein